MTSIHVSQLVRVDISFDVAVLTIEKKLLNIILFADDTSIFYSTRNIVDITCTVNNELEKLDMWFRVNKLSLNVNKTNFIMFTNKKQLRPTVNIVLNGKNMKNSRLNAYICPHSFTPLASKTQIPPRCCRDYTKETGICRQRSAARQSNGGKPEVAPQQYRDVTTLRQTCHFRSRRRQISRWPRL